MLFINTEVRRSSISGEGLFTLEFLPKGKIISIYACEDPDDRIIDEKLYLEEYENASEIYQHSFIRLIGHYQIGNDREKGLDDYINHSDSPNLLSHCGVFLAVRDIAAGEELTLDYRYLMPENFPEKFVVNGQLILGLSNKEALLRSARKLIEILEDIDDLS